jgi:hypothetical protein
VLYNKTSSGSKSTSDQRNLFRCLQISQNYDSRILLYCKPVLAHVRAHFSHDKVIQQVSHNVSDSVSAIHRHNRQITIIAYHIVTCSYIVGISIVVTFVVITAVTDT